MRDPFLQAAIDEAKQGLAEGGIPIGSVIVYHGEIIGRGHNMRVQKGDPLSQGETSGFSKPAANRRRSIGTASCTQPCRRARCAAGHPSSIRFPKIVIGENKTFQGAEDWLQAQGVGLVVVQDDECIAMMRKFISEHSGLWNEDIAV